MRIVTVSKVYVVAIHVVRKRIQIVRSATVRSMCSCVAGTSWSGTSCVGTPVVTPTPSLTGLALKEGIDMIDTTCASATATFPQCLEPSNACDLSACNGDDTCVPDGTDGICTTKRVLNCTCAYGLECVPLSFNSYKCVGNFQQSSCPLGSK